MADISKINPGNGTTYTIKDASALATLSISGNVLTGTTRGGASVNVTLPSGNDESVRVIRTTANASYPLMAVNATSPTTGATYQAICNTGITINPNTQLLSVSGEVNARNGFFQTSDINKKNIIGDLDLVKAYDLIDKCQTILYTLKDDDSDKE